ncbi:MAG: hypothetical protein H0Z28_10165 [Archaeoglobus sp.]|nr:hypothetical protein [Archaeoglobus sp.]
MAELVIDDLWRESYSWREKRVGKHSRTVNGSKVISPRIVLSQEFNDFIGKTFDVYVGKGELTDWGGKRRGKFLLLFFEESKKSRRSEEEDDYDDYDDYEE